MNKGPVMPLLSLADESHHDFPGDPYALSKNKKPLLREALEVGVISSHPRTVYGGEPHRLGGKLYVVRQGFVNINLQDVWQLPRDKEETSWSCSVGLNPCFFALPRMPVMSPRGSIVCSEYPVIQIFAVAGLQRLSLYQFKGSRSVRSSLGPQESGAVQFLLKNAVRKVI